MYISKGRLVIDTHDYIMFLTTITFQVATPITHKYKKSINIGQTLETPFRAICI